MKLAERISAFESKFVSSASEIHEATVSLSRKTESILRNAEEKRRIGQDLISEIDDIIQCIINEKDMGEDLSSKLMPFLVSYRPYIEGLVEELSTGLDRPDEFEPYPLMGEKMREESEDSDLDDELLNAFMTGNMDKVYDDIKKAAEQFDKDSKLESLFNPTTTSDSKSDDGKPEP